MIEERFKELCAIAYHSTLLTYASVNTKLQIAVERRNYLNTEGKKRKVLIKDSAEYAREESRWQTLVGLLQLFKSFLNSKEDIATGGVFKVGYKIIEMYGVEVEPISKYNAFEIVAPLTFSEEPSAEIIALQEKYKNSKGGLDKKTNPWDLQIESMMDELLFDVYRSIAAGLWCYDEVKILQPDMSGEKAEQAFKYWDLLSGQIKAFLYWGRECFARAEDTMIKQMGIIRTADEIMDRKVQIINTSEQILLAKGGLFAINYNSLPKEWKEKVEVHPVKIK